MQCALSLPHCACIVGASFATASSASNGGLPVGICDLYRRHSVEDVYGWFLIPLLSLFSYLTRYKVGPLCFRDPYVTGASSEVSL